MIGVIAWLFKARFVYDFDRKTLACMPVDWNALQVDTHLLHFSCDIHLFVQTNSYKYQVKKNEEKKLPISS